MVIVIIIVGSVSRCSRHRGSSHRGSGGDVWLLFLFLFLWLLLGYVTSEE